MNDLLLLKLKRMKSIIKFSSVLLIVLYLAVQNSIAQDEILFRRYIISSGWNGLFYGGALDIITGLDGAGAAGVPVITAGACALMPLLTNSSKTITPNQLVLTSHGRTLGWAHGFALATLIGGRDAWESDNSNNYKYTVGLGALSSIGLGILGNSLGKNKDWSEGQVALYRHYGWIMPFTGFSIMAAFSDEPRLFGGSILLFGAGGYYLADKINSWHEFTRGEVRATQVLTMLNTGLGYGIFADNQDINESFNRTDWLIPAAGALSGTFLGHLWLKNTNLTPQQGMTTAYAAAGGAIIGLGIALVVNSEKVAPWYLIPYATGLGAYAFTVEKLRKKNSVQTFLPVNNKNNFQVAFMPQNLFLNNKMQNNSFMINGRLIVMQPVFAASVTF